MRPPSASRFTSHFEPVHRDSWASSGELHPSSHHETRYNRRGLKLKATSNFKTLRFGLLFFVAGVKCSVSSSLGESAVKPTASSSPSTSGIEGQRDADSLSMNAVKASCSLIARLVCWHRLHTCTPMSINLPRYLLVQYMYSTCLPTTSVQSCIATCALLLQLLRSRPAVPTCLLQAPVTPYNCNCFDPAK